MKESPFYHWDQESLHIVDLALEYESQEAVVHLQIIETSTDSLAIPQFGWALIRTYQISSDRKRLSQEFLYRDGKLHGPQRRFYVDDRVSPQIAAESWYKEGILHGRCFGWHPKTASLILDIPYKEGKRHGKARSWNEKGILTSEIMMVHGVLDGTMKTYHPTLGTLARSQEWQQGARDGIDFLYHEEEGFLLFCEEWRSGVKVEVIAEDLLEKNLHEKIKSE